LLNLRHFIALLREADDYFRREKPAAVVLIDYPGFNWLIAKRAKRRGIPVFYYSPPQIWAWGSWRAKKMRRFVDHVLCGLPFEQTWLRSRGCNATFVGHPYFDELAQQSIDQPLVQKFRTPLGPLVAILPGSRDQEVKHNLPWFLKAAEIVQKKVPDTRFAIAAFKESQAVYARELLAETNLNAEAHVGRTGEIILAAECCMAVSGSVSLELLYHGKPTVILYWISRSAHWVQSWFRKVRYITLVNLLIRDDIFVDRHTLQTSDEPERALFPEYLTWGDKSIPIANHITTWLTNGKERTACVDQLTALKQEVAHGGASRRAAEYMLDVLGVPGIAKLAPGASGEESAPLRKSA